MARSRNPVDLTIEVEGLRDLRAALRDAEIGYTELKGVGAEAAEVVVEAAHPLVPVLSGALYRSIRGAGQAAGAVVRAGRGPTSDYAGVQHFGWPEHNIEPTMFLYDAIDSRTAEIIKVYQRGVDRITGQF